MTARKRLTAEQKQLLATIKAGMQAENEAKVEPVREPRLALDLPHGVTESYSYRLPVTFKKHLDDMCKEIKATQGAILWHLMKFACTGIRTPEYVKISESLAFKTFGDTMKD